MNFSEIVQIILGILFLVIVYALTRYGIYWRLKRAGVWIIRDLEGKQALDTGKAVELLYAKPNYFRIGLRDFRPKAVENLVRMGIVGVTAQGKYYLLRRTHDLRL